MKSNSHLTPGLRLILVIGCLAIASLEAPQAAGALAEALSADDSLTLEASPDQLSARATMALLPQ
ncbi:MAG: hypothetical protein ACI8QC_000144 [Planctomycetota bacterium]